jgi:hypothetical protein
MVGAAAEYSDRAGCYDAANVGGLDHGSDRQFGNAFCVYLFWLLTVNCRQNPFYVRNSESAGSQDPARG